jgi:hypothetical protein
MERIEVKRTVQIVFMNPWVPTLTAPSPNSHASDLPGVSEYDRRQ